MVTLLGPLMSSPEAQVLALEDTPTSTTVVVPGSATKSVVGPLIRQDPASVPGIGVNMVASQIPLCAALLISEHSAAQAYSLGTLSMVVTTSLGTMAVLQRTSYWY
jgi:hypothetical protein